MHSGIDAYLDTSYRARCHLEVISDRADSASLGIYPVIVLQVGVNRGLLILQHVLPEYALHIISAQ